MSQNFSLLHKIWFHMWIKLQTSKKELPDISEPSLTAIL